MNPEQPLPDSLNHVNLRCKTNIVFMGKNREDKKMMANNITRPLNQPTGKYAF